MLRIILVIVFVDSAQITRILSMVNHLIMLFFEFQSHDRFVSRKCDHEIETQISIISEF